MGIKRGSDVDLALPDPRGVRCGVCRRGLRACRICVPETESKDVHGRRGTKDPRWSVASGVRVQKETNGRNQS